MIVSFFRIFMYSINAISGLSFLDKCNIRYIVVVIAEIFSATCVEWAYKTLCKYNGAVQKVSKNATKTRSYKSAGKQYVSSLC